MTSGFAEHPTVEEQTLYPCAPPWGMLCARGFLVPNYIQRSISKDIFLWLSSSGARVATTVCPSG